MDDAQALGLRPLLRFEVEKRATLPSPQAPAYPLCRESFLA
jgi:hypothetical protein